MRQTYKTSAGAPEIDRKRNDTYDLMCRQESIQKAKKKKEIMT